MIVHMIVIITTVFRLSGADLDSRNSNLILCLVDACTSSTNYGNDFVC